MKATDSARSMEDKIARFRQEIISELMLIPTYAPQKKDILVVVRDQLEYAKKCFDSIERNTEDYELFVWDNGSRDDTKEYLEEKTNSSNFHLIRSEENLGFIIPNNRLAAMGDSPYLILLNSDTEVLPDWDKAMISYLRANPEVGETGFLGSRLNARGEGGEPAFGRSCDYICGWCACVPRAVYDRVGLFDELNLEFAYAEDSDFSLRLKEAGYAIHSLHLDLVIHHENKTIEAVKRESGSESLRRTFARNHEYIRSRWAEILSEGDRSGYHGSEEGKHRVEGSK